MFYREFLAGSRHLVFPLAALVLFFLVFLGVVIRLVRGIARKQSFDHLAALPLEDEAAAESTGGRA